MSRTVWYPGHMARGGRKLAELADKLDLIIEVRDARAPFSTSSPLIAKFAHSRPSNSKSSKAQKSGPTCPVLRVLTKKDLADPERTRVWLSHLGTGTFALDLRHRDGLTPLRRALAERKPAHRELRLAVMGIPNVGKSMLLNALVGKAQAQVGGIPGVTRNVSWYRTSTTGRSSNNSNNNNDLLVVDSPGILDPHVEPGVHLVLSWLGCAKAEVVGGYEAAATLLIKFLLERGLFTTVFKKWDITDATLASVASLSPSLLSVSSLSSSSLLTEAVATDTASHAILELVGRRLGCLLPGGVVNIELAARRLIDSFASGKLAPVTLELPGDPIFQTGLSEPENEAVKNFES